MIDWQQLFLFELILMRMSGFILFNPLLGRNNLPGTVKAGLIMVLSVSVFGLEPTLTVEAPSSIIVFALIMCKELGVGFVLGFVMRLFFMVVQVGGEIIDTQMGITMAQIYDAGNQSNMTVSASLLNILLVLNFFGENGHYTLMRLLECSGELLPYGAAVFGQATASYVAELFFTCMILAVKLALPILAAEVLGEIGMGILMKAIPQINAFVINMELKVIIGLVLLFVFLTPFNEFLLQAEAQMLTEMEQAVRLLGTGG